jgi:biotin carboxyl carrier protein
MEAAYGSGIVAALLGVGLLAGCAGPSAPAVAENPAGSPAPVIAEAPPPAPFEATSVAKLPLQPPTLPGPYIDDPDRNATFGLLACSTEAMQGGFIVCRTDSQAALELDGSITAFADVNGIAVIGVPRKQNSPATVTFSRAKPGPEFKSRADIFPVRASVAITKRHDDTGVIEMECSKIAPQTDEQKKKAEESWVKKDVALRKFHAPYGPLKLVRPVDATREQYSISSFGKTRTYQPKTKDCEPTVNVHNGTDIAVPAGTEIRAPMAGTVLLADPDLYFEGGSVFLDLGYGLVSVTMHMSRIDVKAGDTVLQGQLLGLSGATGRVTGPHVHWAIKYRDIGIADRSGDFWIDPMLLLDIAPPA